MAVPIPGTTPRILDGGQTGAQRAAGFVTVQTSGARELARELLRASTRFGRDATKPLTDAAKAAMKQVTQRYIAKAQQNQVSGNLYRSVRVQAGKKKYEGVGIAVGGPVHVTDAEGWDVAKKGAGNHAWLVEFGTGRRRPSTQGRRTYLNVHEKINNSFRPIRNDNPSMGGRFDNEQFERMGRGFYFIMGTKNNPNRRQGAGYPHDFLMALAPGQTYGAMPARGWMEESIREGSGAALQSLIAALKQQIESIQRAA